MKIEYQEKDENIVKPEYDLSQLIEEWQKEYRTVYQCQIDDIVFFYRTITRKEWKQLGDSGLSNIEAEDVICSCCTIWPINFDFDNCDAGIPTKLAKMITTNSFLDSIEHRQQITTYYRNEMFDFQNQITCIINEAFPQYDIEEIENWDIEKTAKYLSRAEWKLVNLRGATIQEDPNIVEQQGQKKPRQEIKEQQQENKKQKLTPEKLAELKAKYPEMKWGEIVDSVDKIGPMADTTTPGLRPGF